MPFLPDFASRAIDSNQCSDVVQLLSQQPKTVLEIPIAVFQLLTSVEHDVRPITLYISFGSVTVL